MRNFFSNYWKVIVAIVLAIVLATLTLETKSDDMRMSSRLAQHAQRLLSADAERAVQHISSTLSQHGYAPQVVLAGGSTRVEVALSNLAPGSKPARTIILGAHLGPDGSAGAVLALELATSLRQLRPTPGTEMRFVFIVHDSSRLHAGRSNFLAFIGTPGEAARAQRKLATLQGQVPQARLAFPAHALGVTGLAHMGAPGTTVLATDAVFLHYPYLNAHSAAEPRAVQAMAQVVRGLQRALQDLGGLVAA